MSDNQQDLRQRLLWEFGAWALTVTTAALCYFGYWQATIPGVIAANVLGYMQGLDRGYAIAKRVCGWR